VSYAGATAAVTVSLSGNTASGGAGTDTLSFFQNILGSAYADVLTGDDNGNTLDGGGGNDTLIGGLGSDVLVGGNGSDTVSYAGSSAGVTANLTSSVYRGVSQGAAYSGYGGGNDAAGDVLSNVENLIGSSYNDALMGTTGDNTINGGAGNDLMWGDNGNDVIYANSGNDTAYGENNNDTFYVSTATSNLPNLIDGGGRDAGYVQNHGGNVMVLQDLVNNGSYTMTSQDTTKSLAAKVNSIDTISIRGDGASTTLVMTSADVQAINDGGTGSQIWIKADKAGSNSTGDQLSLSLATGETYAKSSITSLADGNGTVFTDYTIFNASMAQVAQIHWAAS
jgi:hypothetical protein